MSKIVLVTGGVRSGKSRFAASFFEGAEDVTFIATMRALDDETCARAAAHRACRPAGWKTAEEPLYPSKAADSGSKYILDCITLLTTNIMLELSPTLENFGTGLWNEIYRRVKGELEGLIGRVRAQDGTLVLVTNETGFSVVPENEAARVFRDLLGAVNRDTAALCDEVYLSVCGCQLKIK
jgi:adenosylcobinamide kinase/adenosylcobinamide-phosphate guanylyltransferase